MPISGELERAPRTIWQWVRLGVSVLAWTVAGALVGWSCWSVLAVVVWLGSGEAMAWVVGLFLAAVISLPVVVPALARWGPSVRAYYRRRRYWRRMRRAGERWRARQARIASEIARREGPLRVVSERVRGLSDR